MLHRHYWPQHASAGRRPTCEKGDLEALPFADAGFDAVTAVNSIFCAEDLAAAARELARVVRAGGRVVITARGPPGRSEVMTDLFSAVAPLMPPPPPGKPPKPGALSRPGELTGVLQRAGIRVVDEGWIACPFVFPSAEISWRAHRSAGKSREDVSWQ